MPGGNDSTSVDIEPSGEDGETVVKQLQTVNPSGVIQQQQDGSKTPQIPTVRQCNANCLSHKPPKCSNVNITNICYTFVWVMFTIVVFAVGIFAGAAITHFLKVEYQPDRECICSGFIKVKINSKLNTDDESVICIFLF